MRPDCRSARNAAMRRYAHEHQLATLAEIGRRYGVTRQRVQQIVGARPHKRTYNVSTA